MDNVKEPNQDTLEIYNQLCNNMSPEELRVYARDVMDFPRPLFGNCLLWYVPFCQEIEIKNDFGGVCAALTADWLSFMLANKQTWEQTDEARDKVALWVVEMRTRVKEIYNLQLTYNSMESVLTQVGKYYREVRMAVQQDNKPEDVMQLEMLNNEMNDPSQPFYNIDEKFLGMFDLQVMKKVSYNISESLVNNVLMELPMGGYRLGFTGSGSGHALSLICCNKTTQVLFDPNFGCMMYRTDKLKNHPVLKISPPRGTNKITLLAV